MGKKLNANETPNANANEDRAEILRLANTDEVAEMLGIKEGRVRALVREGLLAYEPTTIAGTKVTINIITDANVAEYQRKVASGEIGSRKRESNTTAFVVYVPNEQVEQFTAAWTSAEIKHTLRNKPKNADGTDADNDNDGDNEMPSAENVNAETSRRRRNADTIPE